MHGRGLGALRHADTIVIPGWRNAGERPPQVAAVGPATGVPSWRARGFDLLGRPSYLAAAGLLDGRRATTHWRDVDRLARDFPRIRVEPDVLYVDERRVLTSAGSAAGIDLRLHIIRNDFGAEIANTVAKRLVVPPHRDGGQSQYISAPVHGVRMEVWPGCSTGCRRISTATSRSIGWRRTSGCRHAASPDIFAPRQVRRRTSGSRINGSGRSGFHRA